MQVLIDLAPLVIMVNYTMLSKYGKRMRNF